MNEAYCSGKLRLTKALVNHRNIATSLNLLSSGRAGKRPLASLPITSCLTVWVTQYADLTSHSDELTVISMNMVLGVGGFISVSA